MHPSNAGSACALYAQEVEAILSYENEAGIEGNVGVSMNWRGCVERLGEFSPESWRMWQQQEMNQG